MGEVCSHVRVCLCIQCTAVVYPEGFPEQYSQFISTIYGIGHSLYGENEL